MGLLSNIFKGIKKVIRKVGGGIKRLVKKVGGIFGKMGILGHIGMMFLMPYAQSFWGSLGKFGTQLATGTSVAGKAFGNIMRGVYHAGKAVGTVYRGVTEAIEGSLKWLSNKAGLTDIANPFSGLDKVVQDAQNWGRAGWTGNKVHEISTYALPDKIGTTGSGRPEGMPMEDYIESLDKKQRELMEGPKGLKVSETLNETKVAGLDLPEDDFFDFDAPKGGAEAFGKDLVEKARKKSLLSKLADETTGKLRDTITGAPSAVIRDTLSTGVQKAVMGKPQVSYGGSIQFNMGGTNKVITDSQIGGDPNNLYSQGYRYGSAFMEPFNQQSLIDDGWDEHMEFLAPSDIFDYATATGR